MGEVMAHGSFTDRWRMRIGGKLVFAETVRLDGDISEKLARRAVANGGVAIGTALIVPGDEAIVFDPSYDSYVPSIQVQGARAIRIPLRAPEFAIDWQRVAAAVTPRTRLLMMSASRRSAIFTSRPVSKRRRTCRNDNVSYSKNSTNCRRRRIRRNRAVSFRA